MVGCVCKISLFDLKLEKKKKFSQHLFFSSLFYIHTRQLVFFLMDAPRFLNKNEY